MSDEVVIVPLWLIQDTINILYDNGLRGLAERIKTTLDNPPAWAEWVPMRLDWGAAPDWAQWWAMDESGCGYWYRDKPKLVDDCWNLNSADQKYDKEYGWVAEWRDTLRKRPAAQAKGDA